MDILFNSFEDDWDSWSEIQESLDCINGPVIITGTLGLWHGIKEIIPTECDNIFNAINKCLNQDIDDIIIKYDNNKYILDCYHHDGINHLILLIK